LFTKNQYFLKINLSETWHAKYLQKNAIINSNIKSDINSMKEIMQESMAIHIEKKTYVFELC